MSAAVKATQTMWKESLGSQSNWCKNKTNYWEDIFGSRSESLALNTQRKQLNACTCFFASHNQSRIERLSFDLLALLLGQSCPLTLPSHRSAAPPCAATPTVAPLMIAPDITGALPFHLPLRLLRSRGCFPCRIRLSLHLSQHRRCWALALFLHLTTSIASWSRPPVSTDGLSFSVL